MRKYLALKRQHRQQTQQNEMLAAVVARTFIHHSMSPPSKPVPLWRLMPSFWGREEEMEAKEAAQSVREVLGALAEGDRCR